MELKPIVSTRIKAIGYYDEDSTLVILFTDNKKYEYNNVPKFMYKDLLINKSPGKYFDANIKGKYSFEKV